MKACIETIFPASAAVVWARVKRSDTLLYITRGMLGFAGSGRFPEYWREGDTQHTRLLFFGVLPGWRHRLFFERVDDDQQVLLTREGGGLVPVWNHRIEVEPLDTNRCSYRDEIEIQAGLLTPVVWLYAQVLYRYRQWRWRWLLQG